MICHSERDWEKPGAPPVEGRRDAGRADALGRVSEAERRRSARHPRPPADSTPFAHQVSNRGEPTFCTVCGQEHGLGELNDGEPQPGIDLAPASYDRYTGIDVRVPESDDTLTVEAGTGGLTVRFGDCPPMDVVALSPDRILVPGMLRAPLRFEFNGGRRATRVIDETVDPVVLVRKDPSPEDND